MTKKTDFQRDFLKTPLAKNFLRPSESESAVWFLPDEEPQGVALVMHGLNLKPSWMNPLSDHLREKKILVLRGSLPGHCGDYRKYSTSSTRKWQNSFQNQVNAAGFYARRFDCPFYFLGYSLGGLLAQDYLSRSIQSGRDRYVFDRQLLLAPAVAIRPFGPLVRRIYRLNQSLAVPSFTPRECRVHSLNPIRVYHEAIRLHSAMGRRKFKTGGTPTRVLCDPRDEVVSYRGIEKWIETYELENWSLQPIKGRSQNWRKGAHHLIISPSLISQTEWGKVIQNIDQHFNLNKANTQSDQRLLLA
jgi:hypothetical protein